MLPLRDSVPGRTTPYVTVGLIVVNFLVWFWELKAPGVDVHVFRDGYYPCALDGPCRLPPGFHALPWYEGVFTGMFMHASWEHILGNMLFLWIFGNNVEDTLGRPRFIAFYLLGGLFATLSQTIVTLEAGSRTAAQIPNVGASGAIAAVLGAYIVLFPGGRVFTWVIPFFFFELPALLFLGIWFLLQLFLGSQSVVAPEQGGGVAFFAHVGGFVFGLLAIRLFSAGRPRPVRPAY